MDSVPFVNASLNTLVTNLNQSTGLSRFQHLFKHTEKARLLLCKGVYCSEYMDGPEKIELRSLPPIYISVELKKCGKLSVFKIWVNITI